jgi:hypothetical protein
MSVREIATVGHPVLRRRAREVASDELRSPGFSEFVERVGS